MMLIRNEIQYERLTSERISYEKITIKVKEKNKCSYIMGIVRPPGLSRKTFIEEFGNSVGQLGRNDEIVTMSDMNINVNDLNLYGVKEYVEMMASLRLLNMIAKPTREDPNTGSKSMVDHILINALYNQIHSAVIESSITDPYAVIYFRPMQSSAIKESSLSLSCISTVKVELLRETNWDDILNIDDTVSLYRALSDKMASIYEKSTAVKK